MDEDTLFNARALRKTSQSERFPWRDETAPLIGLMHGGVILQAHTPGEKRMLIRSAQADKEIVVLAVWPGMKRSDVFVIDDYDKALSGLN